jgi:putative alpha-1,2-mannosidase
MKSIRLFLVASMLLIPGPVSAQFVYKIDSPVDYLTPNMDTESEFLLSHGNVCPAIALPSGINFRIPHTGETGSGWQYTCTDERIRGFKQTHMSSPWMNDYGHFSIMHVSGEAKVTEDDRASLISQGMKTVPHNMAHAFISTKVL